MNKTELVLTYIIAYVVQFTNSIGCSLKELNILAAIKMDILSCLATCGELFLEFGPIPRNLKF